MLSGSSSFSDIPINLQNIWNAKNRSFCLLSITSTPSTHGVETKSIQHYIRCDAATIDQKSLCIPTILLDKSSPPQSLNRPKREADSCDTNVVHPSLASRLLAILVENPLQPPKQNKFSKIH